eukprot:TRINITY_DN17280_c0_g1_i1.p1 TRINITY_DN17280_c0_g1~~TRINITY_DN17280_c0_g1_i1.p1  ORF type:complete len:119 (-),score=11.85 TRINITY_DN17280_c0_g1_i1:377-733(-)
MGMVRIRLARFGRRNLPFYRIFVADSRSPRDGKHLDIVGHYNPLPGKDGMKRIGINTERVKYWLSVGAQPSETVARLLSITGILPPPVKALNCPRTSPQTLPQHLSDTHTHTHSTAGT